MFEFVGMPTTMPKYEVREVIESAGGKRRQNYPYN